MNVIFSASDPSRVLMNLILETEKILEHFDS